MNTIKNQQILQKKLINHLNKKYLHLSIASTKIAIPYWCNTYSQGILLQEGPFGGKGTPDEIADVTIQAIHKDTLNPKKLTQTAVLQTMNKHHIGLDCSGFAYQMIDFYYRLQGGHGIYFHLKGVEGRLGIRLVNSDSLTNPKNSKPILPHEVQTGDLIRINNGRHVIFVLFRDDTVIHYAHSSHLTKINGVHRGKVTISSHGPTTYLWSETTIDNKPYSNFISASEKTLFFRPLLFC